MENKNFEFDAKEIAMIFPYKKPASYAELKMNEIKESLNEKQGEAFEIAMRGKNMFISSSGGCGKTYLLNSIASYFQNAKHKNVLITASTGTAAQLVDGITVHKAFNFPIGVCFTNTGKHIVHSPRNIINTDVLIVEEVSMCRCDIVDSIFLSVSKANEKRKELKKKPIQVLFFGDMLQLPAVLTNEDKEQLDTLYRRSVGNGYAFQGDHWYDFNFKYFELDEIVRQKDQEDVKLLNHIREGSTIDYHAINLKASSEKFENAVWIYPYNRQVRAKNLEELQKIKEEEFIFYPTIEGDVSQEEVQNSVFHCKVGAKVMITSNPCSTADWFEILSGDLDDANFSNGSIGIVRDIYKDETDDEEDYVIVELIKNNSMIKFKRKRYDLYNYKSMASGKLHKYVRGYYYALPLKLAWSISIHSSQGQTFDYLNLNPRNMFASSQLYVALSRVKSLEHLYLEDMIRPEDIIVDYAVIEFYKKMRGETK